MKFPTGRDRDAIEKMDLDIFRLGETAHQRHVNANDPARKEAWRAVTRGLDIARNSLRVLRHPDDVKEKP